MRETVFARIRRLPARARAEGGFGMVELLVALGVMAVGVMAVFAMFQSGLIQIGRASTVSTAAVLADNELEQFRAIRYDSIGLAQSDLNAIGSGDPYKTDGAWNATTTVILPKCGTAPCTSALPSQTKTGGDNRQYLVHTYVKTQAVTGGRNVKLVTIVVRGAAAPNRVWARVASTFDESTGL